VHDGALPPWLAPTHVRVLPVVDDVVGAAARDVLVAAGLRVSLDDRDATLASRVRDAQQAKVPYVAVIGRDEAAAGTVAVRLRDGSRPGPMPLAAFVDLVCGAVVARRPGSGWAP
jgi:threonyl-tRNA synthetase